MPSTARLAFLLTAFITALSACTSAPRSPVAPSTRTSITSPSATSASILVRGDTLPQRTLPKKTFLHAVHYAGSFVFTRHARGECEIYSTTTGQPVTLDAPVKNWQHVGASWFQLFFGGSSSVLYRVDGEALTRVASIENPVFAISATDTHVAILNKTGSLTMYEVEGDRLVHTFVTTLTLKPDGVDLPAMSWVPPYALLALTPDPRSSATIIFDKDLLPLVTIEGRLFINNSAMASGILPLLAGRGDRTELVQVDSGGRLLNRTRVPGSMLYISMPSPDGTQAVVSSPGLLKGRRTAVITIDASGAKPTFTISPALRDAAIGWSPDHLPRLDQ